jgi:PBP1b-binding outer membrane lipoprotein LpoB
MSKSAKIVLVVGIAAFLAACAPKPEVVEVVEVTAEPTYTGKYK